MSTSRSERSSPVWVLRKDREKVEGSARNSRHIRLLRGTGNVSPNDCCANLRALESQSNECTSNCYGASSLEELVQKSTQKRSTRASKATFALGPSAEHITETAHP
eukprot:5028112-Amphidinium_carterae.2